MKDTDTGILSSEANECCSNFPGTKPELNIHLPQGPLAWLCTFLGSCSAATSLHWAAAGGLVGNSLECHDQGPRWDLSPRAPPWGGASPSIGRFQARAAEAWVVSSFCLCWLCILSLWMSKKLDVPPSAVPKTGGKHHVWRICPAMQPARYCCKSGTQCRPWCCFAVQKKQSSLENVIKMGSGLISTPEAGLVTQASRATVL